MTHPAITRVAALGATLALAGGALSACGGSDDSSSSGGSSSSTTATTSADSLKGICPDTVVLQADWEPEAEHAAFYSLLGDGYTVDTQKKSVTGPLMDGTTDTGVKVQIRIGGASVSYQDPSSMMYQDKSILLGFSRVGDDVAIESKTPVVSVMASMAKSPYAIYWDPKTYPDVKTIADLKAKNVKILTQGEGQTSTWAAFFAGSGITDKSQYDDSNDSKPATFVAAGGKKAEVGFITAEPYLYEHEVKAWDKPVMAQTMGDAGYPDYFQAIVARKDDITAQAACFKKLIPIMQKGLASYIQDGTAVDKKIVDIVSQYDDSWQYNAGAAAYAHDTGVKLGILGPDPTSGVIGKFDPANVQKLIDINKQYRKDITVPASMTPDTLVTNQFIDDSIK